MGGTSPASRHLRELARLSRSECFALPSGIAREACSRRGARNARACRAAVRARGGAAWQLPPQGNPVARRCVAYRFPQLWRDGGPPVRRAVPPVPRRHAATPPPRRQRRALAPGILSAGQQALKLSCRTAADPPTRRHGAAQWPARASRPLLAARVRSRHEAHRQRVPGGQQKPSGGTRPPALRVSERAGIVERSPQPGARARRTAP